MIIIMTLWKMWNLFADINGASSQAENYDYNHNATSTNIGTQRPTNATSMPSPLTLVSALPVANCVTSHATPSLSSFSFGVALQTSVSQTPPFVSGFLRDVLVGWLRLPTGMFPPRKFTPRCSACSAVCQHPAMQKKKRGQSL